MKYPHNPTLKLPFVPKIAKVVEEQPKNVMHEALEMLQRKRREWNPEIIESALRLAMTKREECCENGVFSLARSLKRSRVKKETVIDIEQPEKVKQMLDKKALWNKAIVHQC